MPTLGDCLRHMREGAFATGGEGIVLRICVSTTGGGGPWERRRRVFGNGNGDARGGRRGIERMLGAGVVFESGVDMLARKILAREESAASCASPMVANGAAGDGLRRACVRASAALRALSAEERDGIGASCGKNSTVRMIRSARVDGTYTR